ncbi:hypothetical protein VTN31DRAFT_6624 [Thermomyces dupontii]|uniref:uncharacterized protein n=1 Tax=Talaromyces thermophilus TaxID=28565 RepID=UPI0037429CE7
MTRKRKAPPSFLDLPPEIRLQIYRYLLVSPRTLRMRKSRDPWGAWQPNALSPAILCTNRTIYREALPVLYRENIFRAHRIDHSHVHAPLIKRVKFIVGTAHREYLNYPNNSDLGERDATALEKFLIQQYPHLELLVLEFLRSTLDDRPTCDRITIALLRAKYAGSLMVIRNSEKSGDGKGRGQFHVKRMMDVVEKLARLRDQRPEAYKALSFE